MYQGSKAPSVLLLGMNWNIAREEDVKSVDIYKMCIGLSDMLAFQDIFDVEKGFNANNFAFYNLKALICFVGNHYLVFIRSHSQRPQPERKIFSTWTLYNDTQVRDFKNGWVEVVDYCIDTKAVPTLVIYDQTKYQ